VYLAIDTDTQTPVAIKQVGMIGSKEGHKDSLKKEIDLLK